jgi:hypothetical protein
LAKPRFVCFSFIHFNKLNKERTVKKFIIAGGEEDWGMDYFPRH